MTVMLYYWNDAASCQIRVTFNYQFLTWNSTHINIQVMMTTEKTFLKSHILTCHLMILKCLKT